MTPAKASFRPNLTRPPRLENSLGRGRVKTLKGEDRAALFSLFSFSDSGHQWV